MIIYGPTLEPRKKIFVHNLLYTPLEKTRVHFARFFLRGRFYLVYIFFKS